MPGANNSTVLFHQGHIFRTNITSHHKITKVGLLLHGWNGNENAMQIFFSDFPKNVGLIAPRAPFPTNENGYTWAPSLTDWSIIKSSQRLPLGELKISAANLVENLKGWMKFLNCEATTFYVAGFSQGGAMALLLGLLYPAIFSRTACLSGFLPDETENEISNKPANDSSFLVTHGTLDEIVSIEKGRETYTRLKDLGLQVDYCEDQIGHKIGVECRKKLGTFFNQQSF
jgi:phospholipase/carboxylesterase